MNKVLSLFFLSCIFVLFFILKRSPLLENHRKEILPVTKSTNEEINLIDKLDNQIKLMGLSESDFVITNDINDVNKRWLLVVKKFLNSYVELSSRDIDTIYQNQIKFSVDLFNKFEENFSVSIDNQEDMSTVVYQEEVIKEKLQNSYKSFLLDYLSEKEYKKYIFLKHYYNSLLIEKLGEKGFHLLQYF